jgi:hypothetical protein
MSEHGFIIVGSPGPSEKPRNLKKAASQSLLPRTAIRRHSYPGLSFASVVRRVSDQAPPCNAPDLHCLIDDPLARKQFARFHTGHFQSRSCDLGVRRFAMNAFATNNGGEVCGRGDSSP